MSDPAGNDMATPPNGDNDVVAQAAAPRRELMMDAVDSTDASGRLAGLVQVLLDESVPPEDLLDDLNQLRRLARDDQEDAILDVMDRLVGWCAPSARLRRTPRRC